MTTLIRTRSRPVVRVLLSVVFLVSLSGVSYRLLGRQTAGPVVGLDRDAQNWGKVKPGSHLTTDFTISNRGGGTLVPGDPQATCGCATPVVERRSLGPGEVSKLRVGFDVPAKPGHVTHFVKVPTNDPNSPTVTLGLFANSWVGVVPSPQVVEFGSLRAGDRVEASVHLSSPDGLAFRVGSVNVGTEGLKAEVVAGTAPSPIHRLNLALDAPGAVGPFRGYVQVVTDRDDATVIDVPFSGRVVGPVSVSPSALSIDREQAGHPVTHKVIVRLPEPSPRVSVENAACDLPWRLLSAAVESVESRHVLLKFVTECPHHTSVPETVIRFDLVADQSYSLRVPVHVQGLTAPVPSRSGESP